MKTLHLPRFQGKLLGVGLGMVVVLLAACSSVATAPQISPTTTPGTIPATTTGTTPVSATSTPAPAATPTTAPVSFKAGGISFIGLVKSITSTSLVMSAPNGQSYTLVIAAQTDRSAFGGNLPTVGTSVDMDAAVNADGSFTATILKPATPGDADVNNIAYVGITTSAVGADRVIHFTVGTTGYNLAIPTTADLSDFGGNAQAIGSNVSIKVKVQYPSKVVVSVGNANA